MWDSQLPDHWDNEKKPENEANHYQVSDNMQQHSILTSGLTQGWSAINQWHDDIAVIFVMLRLNPQLQQLLTPSHNTKEKVKSSPMMANIGCMQFIK